MNREEKVVDAELVNDETLVGNTNPGPEPGQLPARFGALLLDLILITALCLLFLTQFVFPQYYPGALEELVESVERSRANEEAEPFSQNVLDALRTSNMISIVFVFGYFSLFPALAGGGTLGMRIFNLRIEDRFASAPAPLRAHVVRGAVKTLCLQVLFPFLTLLFLLALRTPQRLAPHDILARTRVVRGPSFRKS